MVLKRFMVKDYLLILNKGVWKLIENDKFLLFWFVCLFVLDYVMFFD